MANMPTSFCPGAGAYRAWQPGLGSLDCVILKIPGQASNCYGEWNLMTELNLLMKSGKALTRIPVTCPHQSGLIYVVPAERSWVCTPEEMPKHALAGFFRELVALKNKSVEELMQDWGVYYRQLPLAGEETASEGAGGT